MSGSRVDIPDKELAQEWPFLTRQQLEEYKDAFRIFDRSGIGSFTAEDIGWVMRSLGQNPTQPQIDAIIRDMDLDNDGVIDLAEFMVRMMALTTKTAAEEDLKHVFDVLDKSGEGMLNADGLRTAIKNIAEWEMTDDDIEVAIKLADKSGDGRIDYDEFIAFVFGDDEPVQRPQTSTNTTLPAQLSSQLEAAHAQAAAAARAEQLSSATTDAAEKAAETLSMSSNSWPAAQESLPANQLSEPQLPTSGLDPIQAAMLAARRQSLTDALVAAQVADMTPDTQTPAEATLQAGTVYENALYQDDAPSAPHAGAPHHVPLWELEDPTASSDLQMPAEQPGDDVRLDIHPDQAVLDHMQPLAEAQLEAHWSEQAAHGVTSFAEDDLGAQERLRASCSQEHVEPLQLHDIGRAPSVSEEFSTRVAAEGGAIAQQSSEPGGLQAVRHGDAVHLHLPLEAHEHAVGSPGASPPDPTASTSAAQRSGHQQHVTQPSAGRKAPAKAPRKVPALSYVQLSQGVNRSQVKTQQSDRRS